MESNRNAELAKIHIGKKQLLLDEKTYQDMLWTLARVHSSADLDHEGRAKVILHMRNLGAVFTQKPRRTRPAATRADQIAKIKAMLAEAKRPDTYADGMAKKMFHVDRYEWLQGVQLGKLIAALVYDAKRHGRRTS